MATEAARDKPYSPCESARGMGNEASNRRLNRYGGGKEPGVTRIYDRTADDYLEQGILDVLATAKKLHEQDGLTPLELEKHFKVSGTMIKNLEKLEELTPEVLEMLSIRRPVELRLSFQAAVLIAGLRDDLQRDVAEEYLAGTCSTEKIRQMLTRLTNRQLAEKHKSWKQKKNRLVLHEEIARFEIRAKRVVVAVTELLTSYEKLKESGVLPESTANDLAGFADTLRLPSEILSTLVEKLCKK